MRWRDGFWGADLGHWVTLCFGQVDAHTGRGCSSSTGKGSTLGHPGGEGTPSAGSSVSTNGTSSLETWWIPGPEQGKYETH